MGVAENISADFGFRRERIRLLLVSQKTNQRILGLAEKQLASFGSRRTKNEQEDRTGQDRTGQDKTVEWTGQDRGHDRIGDRTGRDMTGQDRGRDRTGQDSG